MNEPLVSIIIPVYNGSNYMREAIDSALAQTYNNIEVIVINDGSNDNGATDKIARSYGKRIFYYSKPNGGVSSALNLGIEVAKGEYISWLSHDDVYAATKIEKQIKLLALSKRDNKAAIVMCATQQIDANSKSIGDLKKLKLPTEQVLDWRQALRYVINYSCNGCALLIPKIAFDKCGGFDERLRYSQDFLKWVQIFVSGFSLIYHEEAGVFSRIHAQQVTVTRKELFLHDSKIIAHMLIPELAQISTAANNFLYYYAKTNAIHINCEAVDACIKHGKTYGVISFYQRIALRLFCVYGSVRPFIRRIYYRFIMGVQ